MADTSTRTSTPTGTQQGPGAGFRGDVEGLRAVAVVAVVLFHADLPGLSGGYVGVDVFFVLSGFLITGLLVSEVRRTGTVSLRRFWARRARRLLPLATLVSAVTLAVSWLVMSPLELRDVAADAVWSAFFAMNWHLAREGVDYMAADAATPYQHFWSLAVEEQFYLVWPLLVIGLLLLVRLLGRLGVPRSGDSFVPLLTAVTAVLVVVSFVHGVVLTAQAQPLAYFLPWSRAWELGVGALVALGAVRLARLPGPVREVLAPVGLLAVLLACVLLDSSTPFPGTAALLPVLGTAAVLVAGLGGSTALGRLLSVGPMRTIGRLSYGWYLWHWPVLLLAPRVLGAEPGLLLGLALAGLSLALAAVTYALLEDPVRRRRSLVASPARSLAVGAACVLVAYGAGTATAGLVPPARGDGPMVSSVQAGGGGETEVRRAVQESHDLERVPVNLRPVLDRAEDDVARARNEDGISCMVAAEHVDVSREPGASCVFVDPPDAQATVVLTGDSHAYQWYPAMQRIAEQQDWRLVVMTKAGCPLYDVTMFNNTFNRDYTECEQWRDRAMQRIEAEEPDMVVVSAAVFSPREGDFAQRWAAGVTRSTEQLQERTGALVVSLQDTPIPGRDVPRCVAENLDDVQACTATRDRALTDLDRRQATAQAALAAGAVVVDPVPWFCEEGCPPIIGNTLAYHDGDHISATYAQQLAPLLADRLAGALRSARPAA
ncbi:acyltransferase family protein [Aquipuribacter sp. MA13-6]|uniref:acyltransferase family protein n=1 Tax=unclassified Aquipuribacter TaxID=2635084 RepID=UPI003EEFFEAE